jgi:methylaspartate ammonia-lyase|tara:strand:+ start:1787 stop:2065 length:279 start_codon:yes stop_codon:yes gene_type:complete
MNHKIARRLYQAIEAKYTADIMDARARLSIYFESPVAIGEHPQHTEEIDNLVDQLANATDKLECLSNNFGNEYGVNIPTTEVDEKGKEILKG